MDPREQFCRNRACRAYGRKGEGHVVIHSRRERRYRCKRCRRTFAETAGTALYRLRTARDQVVVVITLLAYGCPIQAIVAAFGLDERTVARWQQRAGAQGRRVHEHLVQAGRVELGQVQADELRVRIVGGVLWLASAIAVPSRLWLGGAVSPARDGALIRALLERVRACGPVGAVKAISTSAMVTGRCSRSERQAARPITSGARPSAPVTSDGPPLRTAAANDVHSSMKLPV